MLYRAATQHDVEAVARLHADSWRRHYRGAYSDAFLDGDVFAERLGAWTDRLGPSREPNHSTTVAELNGEIVGLVHTILEDDPQWGALLDNLHVAAALKRTGIGTRLMSESARVVIDRTPGSALYLWVLENNTAAQAFYEAQGGKCAGRETFEPPGGGEAVGLRYAWPDPSVLLGAST